MSLLKDINLTEAQEKDFLAKLDEWKKTKTTEIREEIKKEFEGKGVAKSRITEDGDIDFTEEETAIMSKKLNEWKESIQAETEDSLGEKFYELYQLNEESLKKQYSEKFVATMKEMYAEIEENVRKKLLESPEFKTFSELKKLVAPYIIEGQYKDTVMEDVEKLKKIISEQKEVIDATVKNADKSKLKAKLDQLTDGMPSNIKEQFIANLGSFQNENELIEAFQSNIKLVKLTKEQVINELKETANVTEEGKEKVVPVVETVQTPVAPVVETPAATIVEEVVVEPVVAPVKKQVVTKPVVTESSSASDEDIIAESDIDYEILSEDFKRETKKSDGLKRLQELAGLV